VRSRWVTATGGLIMVALGLLPKMSALVEAVPVVVLGGAGIVMFGMVAATGARILTGVDFKTNRYNLFVVAIAVRACLHRPIGHRLSAICSPALPPTSFSMPMSED
jgi:xanthine/uracil permease